MNGAGNALEIWPQAASRAAVHADYLILGFTVVTLLLTVPIFISITYFAFKYRSGSKANRQTSEDRSVVIELSWMLIPFFLTLIFFVWGALLFSEQKNAPPGALQISAIGRQWMWKFQHPGGQSEINDLHVPEGQPVVIRMISQDVIHALYIPALRIQMDTIPNRYTELWFKADKVGAYHLFCSEYCGTDHSEMDGTLTIMKPVDYQKWLTQSTSGSTTVAAGEALFQSYGCSGCHQAGSTVKAPSLVGLWQKPVPLEQGGTIVADDSYIRDKILQPNDNKIAGYKQNMPAYKGKIAEDDLIRVVSYIKSLAPRQDEANKDPGP
jgi:cytochrome c oxidase subunit 2